MIALTLICSGLAHGLVLVVSGRPWNGPLSLRKPADFGLSFGVLLASMVWLTTRVAMPPRRRTVVLAALATACVVEAVGVSVQAWRGVPSHFNVGTIFDRSVTVCLAGGGALFVIVLLTCTVAAFRSRAGEASTRLALRAGFLLGDVGLLFGSVMIARGMIWVRDGEVARAYAGAGWLRPVHVLALGGIVALPLVDAVVRRLTSTGRARQIVAGVAVAYTTVVAGALVWLLAAGPG